MYYVNMSADPNQSFSISMNGNTIDVTLRYFREMWYATIMNGEEYVVASVRCVHNSWLLPAYVADVYGFNVRFEDVNTNYPTYDNINKTSVLTLYSTDEIKAM